MCAAVQARRRGSSRNDLQLSSSGLLASAAQLCRTVGLPGAGEAVRPANILSGCGRPGIDLPALSRVLRHRFHLTIPARFWWSSALPGSMVQSGGGGNKIRWSAKISLVSYGLIRQVAAAGECCLAAARHLVDLPLAQRIPPGGPV